MASSNNTPDETSTIEALTQEYLQTKADYHEPHTRLSQARNFEVEEQTKKTKKAVKALWEKTKETLSSEERKGSGKEIFNKIRDLYNQFWSEEKGAGTENDENAPANGHPAGGRRKTRRANRAQRKTRRANRKSRKSRR